MKTKKKVLFTINTLNIGGPQKSLLALLDRINYEIFEVDVLVIQPNGELTSYINNQANIIYTDELITASTIPSYNTLKYMLVLLKNGHIKHFVKAVLSMIKTSFKTTNMNQERQKLWFGFHHKLPSISKEYDVAFGINGISSYIVADLVKSNKKYHWVRSDPRILNRIEKLDSFYYQKMDGALSVSKICADIFTDMYPFMKGKTKVFYNYIPTSFYENIEYDSSLMNTNQNTIKLLTIGRLDPLKGLELAIDACEILVDKGYNFKWYFLGDGPSRKIIEQMIEDKDLGQYIILLGFQLNTLNFIKDADIIVHPSRTEGKSNAVDEAKFIGKPIIVTNYETVGEVIEDRKNGLITEMNGKSLAKAIEELLRDKKLQNKLINNCLHENLNTIDPNKFIHELVT